MLDKETISELQNNPEFYANMIIKLRDRISTLTLMNLELETLLDMEKQKNTMLEEQVNLKNSATTK
jgi:hypothetical protein